MGRRSGVRKPVTLGATNPAASSGAAKGKKSSPTKKSEGTSGGEHAKLIAQYHALNKYRESVDHDPTLSPARRAAKRRKLDAQLAEAPPPPILTQQLGGLEAYQQASLTGETAPEHKFNAGKWVVQELRSAEGSKDASGSQGKLRLLDVGAIRNQYLDHASWLDVTSIDLNPQHPSVIKADFFQFALECKEQFDVVVLSLVINFVGDPRRRGDMLGRCQTLVRDGGDLFIVLPLACINNSRYMKHSRFVKLMKSLGFEMTKFKTSTKLCFYVFKKISAEERAKDVTTQVRAFKRKLCRGGKGRNNFLIILEGKGGERTEEESDGELTDEGEAEEEGEEDEDERPARKTSKGKKIDEATSKTTAKTEPQKRKDRPQQQQRSWVSSLSSSADERPGKRQKTLSGRHDQQQRATPRGKPAQPPISPGQQAHAQAKALAARLRS